jgi:hypothetical protein
VEGIAQKGDVLLMLWLLMRFGWGVDVGVRSTDEEVETPWTAAAFILDCLADNVIE